ncbi:MAG: hypothetical protein U0974_11490 [Gemmatimonadales bacterium]|nr:hypothetical protein [Gemmatimonadales bacterium]
MRVNWKVAFLGAAVAGLAGGSVQALKAAEEQQGSQQCYTQEGATGRCPACALKCLGAGYLCCGIVVDP